MYMILYLIATAHITKVSNGNLKLIRRNFRIYVKQ